MSVTRSRVHPKRIASVSRNQDFTFDFERNEDDQYGIDHYIESFIKQANGEPTNAYGEIEFNASNTAKYIKVSDDTSMDKIYQLVVKHWKLTTPNLIISVTGGARNFSLRTRLKEVFRRSLIKASETTGAWITTGGTRTGVMKHVGKAVEQYSAIKDAANKVVTIGIAPWGVIFKRELLQNHPTPSQLTPKNYDVEDGQQGALALLDHNHSHFILVDNGKEYDKHEPNEIYGSEITLRTNFEGFMGKQESKEGFNVMIVCVIVQGGPGSLKTVVGSIRNGTPVVIVEGSGGWADVLANAYSMEPKEINQDSVRHMIEESNIVYNEESLKEWTGMLKECILWKVLLTVFALDPTDLSRDLDIAILEALLKVSSIRSEDRNAAKQQLKLAIAWNRSDIAKSHILNDDACIGKKDIAKMFCGILRDNKHEFCKVFLHFGVDLKKYFTMEDLELLYASATQELIFYKRLEKKKFSLERVGELMLEYLGNSYINVYKMRHKDSRRYCAINCDWVSTNDNRGLQLNELSPKSKVDDPYREIFQWAILFNRREIARNIWEYMFGATQAAIMASQMLKVLAGQMSRDQDKKTLMLADANEYEMLATGVFANCFLENPNKSFNLLIARLPKWGGYTCLHVAIEADDKHFISSLGVQTFFDRVWTSKLASTNTLHLILAGLCPIFILSTIEFQEKEQLEIDKKSRDDEKNKRYAHERGLGPFNDPEVDLTPQSHYSLPEKITIFYDSPIVTFWLNVVSFLVYLGLFAYIILSDFRTDVVAVSHWEYLLLGWTSTFLVEEFRELSNKEARFICEKLRLHITDAWNIMDITSLALFFIAFGLRYDQSQLYASLILYSLAFMVQCIRLVHIFAVHPVLGPKIIMVGEMLKDLLFFLFILVVFLIAYGVASQAILYPTETDFMTIVVGIIYKPYWQIYGELFLDEINFNPNSDALHCSRSIGDDLPRCPRQSSIVPIISAVYLLLANVLLLNLLIAMFSYTFDKIEGRNKEIWMFQRYNLITDYYFRPPIVPPLIVISHLYLFGGFLIRKISKKLERDDRFRRTLKNDLSEDEWTALRQWEHWHAYAYIHKKRQDDGMRIDYQLMKLSQRIDNISTAMEDIEERMQSSSQKNLASFLHKRLSHLEDILVAFQEKPVVSKVPASSKVEKTEKAAVATTEAGPSTQMKPKETGRPGSPIHVKSRSELYPESAVLRFPVADEKVPWKVEFQAYKPPAFTHGVVLAQPVWADINLEEYTDEERPLLPFNKYDQLKKVVRQSHIGKYYVENGFPKNPKGRTGVIGRGLLGRYGPNHAANSIITRWKRDESGEMLLINGKRVLEFVAVLRTDSNEWAIPGGMVEPGEKLSQTLKREFGEEALKYEGIEESERHNIDALFKSGGLEICRGYCDDHRNTDNAWIETVICNFHDEVGDAFSHISFVAREGESRKVSWLQVDRTLKLFASHKDYLERVAEVHSAYF